MGRGICKNANGITHTPSKTFLWFWREMTRSVSANKKASPNQIRTGLVWRLIRRRELLFADELDEVF